jgi:hypothetical protein
MGERLTVAGRAVAVLAVAGTLMALAPPAVAGKRNDVRYEYGTDISSWYWERQQDQEVAPPPPPEGFPEPPVAPSQRVRLPSPQRPDTLPVALWQGDHERMSALKFDLLQRGVVAGSRITQLILEIEESEDRNEQPSVNVDAAAIEACFIQDFLAAGENEEWKTRPKYAQAGCAAGKRQTPKGKPAFWRFDLTRLAAPWGRDPFSNNGVMLQGVLPKNATTEDTWQVNLKIPRRDAAETPDDEYKLSRDRVRLTLAFVPGEVPGQGTGPLDTGISYSGTGGSSFGPSTSFGTGSSPVSTGGVPAAGTGTGVPSTEPSPASASRPAAAALPQPRLPGYVWALIPLGLLALSAVRSVVMEPAGGIRPDGAIAAIRRRNVERRGGPLREVTDPWSRALAATQRGALAVGRGFRGAGRGLSTAWSKVAGAARKVRGR